MKYDANYRALPPGVLADRAWVAARLDAIWYELACRHRSQSAAALLIAKVAEDAVPQWFLDLFAHEKETAASHPAAGATGEAK